MRIALVPLLLVFLAAFFYNPDDAPAEKKGEVVEVRDGRLMRHDNGWKELRKGSSVYTGDRLRTDKSAVAVFELPELGRYVMGPDAEMQIGKDRKAELKRGSVWMNAKFPKGSTGGISTSLASAGVRGTKFSVFYGRGTKDVCICTCSGRVEAELQGGGSVQVPAGMILVVKGDEPMPDMAESALPMLDKPGVGFDFCFNCHVLGGRGKLKDAMP